MKLQNDNMEQFNFFSSFPHYFFYNLALYTKSKLNALGYSTEYINPGTTIEKEWCQSLFTLCKASKNRHYQIIILIKNNSSSLIYICSRRKSDSFHTLLNTLATDNNSVNHENLPNRVLYYSIKTHFIRNVQNQIIILNKCTFYVIILCLLNAEKWFLSYKCYTLKFDVSIINRAPKSKKIT